jgi:5-methylcytosine-specific restriction endonuclease McrA
LKVCRPTSRIHIKAPNMSYSQEDLRRIYDRTTGYCHICRKKLAFKNYGQPGARAAWEVEHSNPRALGGTNRFSNLYAACIACNRSKGTSSTQVARRAHRRSRAPLSRDARAGAKTRNTWFGAGVGWVAGRVLLGPGAAFGTLLLGALLGSRLDPDR